MLTTAQKAAIRKQAEAVQTEMRRGIDTLDRFIDNLVSESYPDCDDNLRQLSGEVMDAGDYTGGLIVIFRRELGLPSVTELAEEVARGDHGDYNRDDLLTAKGQEIIDGETNAVAPLAAAVAESNVAPIGQEMSRSNVVGIGAAFAGQDLDPQADPQYAPGR